MFPSLMFYQSETQPMKGCDIHHRPPTAVKHTSRFTIAKGEFHIILSPFAILIAPRKLIYPQQ